MFALDDCPPMARSISMNTPFDQSLRRASPQPRVACRRVGRSSLSHVSHSMRARLPHVSCHPINRIRHNFALLRQSHNRIYCMLLRTRLTLHTRRQIRSVSRVEVCVILQCFCEVVHRTSLRSTGSCPHLAVVPSTPRSVLTRFAPNVFHSSNLNPSTLIKNSCQFVAMCNLIGLLCAARLTVLGMGQLLFSFCINVLSGPERLIAYMRDTETSHLVTIWEKLSSLCAVAGSPHLGLHCHNSHHILNSGEPSQKVDNGRV